MNKTDYKEKLIIVVCTFLGMVLLLFIITSVWIGESVKTRCQIAQAKYSGECVHALSSWLDDEQNDFPSRSSAVWALGQLGDSKAVPILKKYYTGEISEREPLDQIISQYELKKALDLANGGLNITHFVWKR